MKGLFILLAILILFVGLIVWGRVLVKDASNYKYLPQTAAPSSRVTGNVSGKNQASRESAQPASARKQKESSEEIEILPAGQKPGVLVN